ncbi:hypothetical protein ACO1PF_10175 [Alkalibacterium sp. f15]|uniref:hypothetical protein n=1 Tax=Alkalibacterium sp. f15 TaxID=3414029 RepID=UPI003BF82952
MKMTITCKKCSNQIKLNRDSIGLKYNYYGMCPCGISYDADYNANTGEQIRELWFELDDIDSKSNE